MTIENETRELVELQEDFPELQEDFPMDSHLARRRTRFPPIPCTLTWGSV